MLFIKRGLTGTFPIGVGLPAPFVLHPLCFRVVYIIAFHNFAKKPERGRLLQTSSTPGLFLSLDDNHNPDNQVEHNCSKRGFTGTFPIGVGLPAPFVLHPNCIFQAIRFMLLVADGVGAAVDQVDASPEVVTVTGSSFDVQGEQFAFDIRDRGAVHDILLLQ